MKKKSIKEEPRVYKGKDNRLRIVYYNKEDNKYHQMSFPKYLMQKHLNREILLNEDVHHINENTLDNNLENLEIVQKGEHQRQHNLNNPNLKKYKTDLKTHCFYCNKPITLDNTKQANHMHNMKLCRSGRLFCSKSCSGKYGKDIQLKNIIIKNPFEKI